MNTRKAIHNPRATAANPCPCPACRAHRTAEGERRASDYNGWAATKTNLFGVILSGDALAPRFNPGDTLAISRDRKPQPGNAVLVNLDGNPNKRAVMILNADGDLVDFQRGYIPAGCFTVEGVVVSNRPALTV